MITLFDVAPSWDVDAVEKDDFGNQLRIKKEGAVVRVEILPTEGWVFAACNVGWETGAALTEILDHVFDEEGGIISPLCDYCSTIEIPSSREIQGFSTFAHCILAKDVQDAIADVNEFRGHD